VIIPQKNDIYFKKRTEVLKKLEFLIKKLILKAEKAQGKNKTNLLHHVIKIQVKKARTDVILRQLIKNENQQDLDDLMVNLGISLRELRKAFSRAIVIPEEKHVH